MTTDILHIRITQGAAENVTRQKLQFVINDLICYYEIVHDYLRGLFEVILQNIFLKSLNPYKNCKN